MNLNTWDYSKALHKDEFLDSHFSLGNLHIYNFPGNHAMKRDQFNSLIIRPQQSVSKSSIRVVNP